MELQIHGRNLEVNESTRDYITRKMGRLSRHLPDITTATVEMSRENSKAQDHRLVAQVTLDMDGTVLRAEERGASATAVVDSVIDLMDRRLERYKGKIYRSKQAKKSGKNASIRTLDVPEIPSQEGAGDDEALEAEGRVVRVKRFPVKPMTVDEAAFQMELLGHDFFLFQDSDTGQHNVIYRRRDGDYGLIQPEPL